MKLLSITFILVLSFTVFGQDKAQPNQWKGLILDQSTAEQAIEKFGKPKSDKIDNVKLFTIDKLLTKQLKEKKWRVLNFKEIENVKNALLVFSSENRLVIIHFEPEQKVTPNAFVGAYETSFKPTFGSLDRAMSSGDFSRDGAGNVYAKNYPTVYTLMATTDKSFVVGMVDNSSFGSILGKSLGIPDSTIAYPGKMMIVELISRTLENKDNVDVLK